MVRLGAKKKGSDRESEEEETEQPVEEEVVEEDEPEEELSEEETDPPKTKFELVSRCDCAIRNKLLSAIFSSCMNSFKWQMTSYIGTMQW